MNRAPLAVFLHGSIGAGKTTLGTALAERCSSAYVDGDQYQLPDRPWFASSLTVARALADAAVRETRSASLVVLGYPLRCVDHLYLKRRLEQAGVRTLFVNLRPPLSSILGPERGRIFTDWERRRTAEMVEQGYNSCSWSDARVDTSGDRESSVKALLIAVQEARSTSAL
jgi:predicted ATPase